MSEYEYEVKFYGSQWVINVLCYHEQDSEFGDTEIINWAIAVADQNGLTIPEYDSASVTKTGESTRERARIMNKLICHAEDCDNFTSETFFHCEQHGGEDGEGENNE